MVRKTAVAGYVLVTLFGIALVDKYCILVAVILCSFVAYLSVKKFLKTWVEGILYKVEHTPLRSSRHHHRKKLIRVRSTCTSGSLLPWIEKIVVLITKLNQRNPSQPSQLEEEYDPEDFSPSSEHSLGFPVDVPNIKYCGNSPTETNEIKTFVNHISQSFIQSWYKSVSNHDEFVQDLDYILEDVLVNLCGRLTKLNMNQLYNQIFILAHNHVYSYCGESTVEDTKSQGNSSRKNGNFQTRELHPALKDQKSELVYLSTVCETLVDLIGPQDMLLCPLLRTLLTEILTCSLLLPTANLVSDPAFVFWTIVFFFGDSKLLNRISKTKDSKTVPQQAAVTKRNLDLRLPLRKNSKHKQQQSGNPDTLARRGRLLRTKSFSYNSINDLDDSEYSGTQQDIPSSPHRITSESNLCSMASDADVSSDVLDLKAENEYFMTRPPFSLFPVPGHSRKAEREQSNSRKSSPTRIFQCLPKKKGKSLPRSMSLHSSQSLDELLLPPTKVFQPNGTHILPVRESSPAPSFSLEVEQAEEATEAADVQQFYNIRIVGTDELYDSAKKKYILYCIQYDYLEPAISETRENELPCLVPCTAVVRRRFREFLALQSRLEKLKIKKHLNGIRGPSKWLSSPFPATDKRNVEKRRVFLQDYLQKLCSREALANSAELHEFLAYKGDARIAFVKKAPELLVPRIDKMVVKGVMGAIDLLKTALPSMPQDSPSCGDGPRTGAQGEKSHSSTRSILTGFTRSKSDSRLPSLEFSCKMERASPLSQQIYNFLDSFDTSSSPEDSRPSSPTLFPPLRGDGGPSRGLMSTSVPAWKRAASRLESLQSPTPPAGPRLRGDGCDSVDLTKEETLRRTSQLEKIQESFQAEIPLANTLVDSFLCIIFPGHSLSDDYAVVAFKVLLGDMLQKWLQKELGHLSSRQKCIHYMHNLHEILWPPGGQTSQKILNLQACREAALQVLMALIPDKLAFILGISEVGINLSVFLDCLQNRHNNKNLLYQVMDVVTDMMCAQDLQQSIL